VTTKYLNVKIELDAMNYVSTLHGSTANIKDNLVVTGFANPDEIDKIAGHSNGKLITVDVAGNFSFSSLFYSLSHTHGYL